MQPAEPRAKRHLQASRKGEAPRPRSRGGYALAVAVLAVTLSSVPTAQAGSALPISDRIEAAFALVLRSPEELRFPLARRALLARASLEGSQVAPLAYREDAFIQMATPAERAIARVEQNPAPYEIALARLPRPRPDVPSTEPAVTGSIALPPQAAALETEFFDRFAGSFSGSGEVRRSANENPNQVQCTLTGRPSASGISISGKCGAFIFSRDISADIRYDPATGRYSGVYVGAKIGPARLSGVRHGDAVVMTITWPKPVNGDTKATMTIRNAGNGKLAITVSDRPRPTAPEGEVTRIALNQI